MCTPSSCPSKSLTTLLFYLVWNLSALNITIFVFNGCCQPKMWIICNKLVLSQISHPFPFTLTMNRLGFFSIRHNYSQNHLWRKDIFLPPYVSSSKVKHSICAVDKRCAAHICWLHGALPFPWSNERDTWKFLHLRKLPASYLCYLFWISFGKYFLSITIHSP